MMDREMLHTHLETLKVGGEVAHEVRICVNDAILGNGFHRLSSLNYAELPRIVPPPFEIRVSSETFVIREDLFGLLPLPSAASPLYKMVMVNLHPLTCDDSKVVYQADLVHKGNGTVDWSPLPITAGDSLAILCQNSHTDVDWLLSRISYGIMKDADSPFTVESVARESTKKVPAWFLPTHTVTLRFLLTYCCELHVPATRRMARILADCCIRDSDDNIDQAECLLSFSSNQFKSYFDMYIRQTNMTFMDLLATFPACKPTIASLLVLLPFLRPRAYSLLDCSDVDNPAVSSQQQLLSFAFTRVDFKSKGEEPVGLVRYPHRKHGVCSGWLERLWNGHESHAVLAYLRKNLSGFRLPENRMQPVIMVAAGTGIAPFISFLRNRRVEIKSKHEALHNQESGKKTLGPMWLIYGCRSPKTSLLFAEELSRSLSDGILHNCCLCFSRFQRTVGKQEDTLSDLPLALDSLGCCHWDSRYVQECIMQPYGASAEHQSQLAELVLKRNAVILVCGENKHMVPAVREAIASIISTYLHKQDGLNSSVNKYMNEMKQNMRYIEDIWA